MSNLVLCASHMSNIDTVLCFDPHALFFSSHSFSGACTKWQSVEHSKRYNNNNKTNKHAIGTHCRCHCGEDGKWLWDEVMHLIFLFSCPDTKRQHVETSSRQAGDFWLIGIRVWIRALPVLKPKGKEGWELERQLEPLMRNRQASVFSIPSVWLQPVHVNLSSHFLFSHLIYCQLLYHPLRHTHAVFSAGLPPPCSFCVTAQLLAGSSIP